MRITYVRQSGFTVELKDTVFIFDYFNGKLLNFSKDKHIVVLVSHKHYDHFNIDIFELANKYENIHFILSDDIEMNESIPAKARENINFIGKDQELVLGPIIISTLKSTDEGVAFIIDIQGVTLYHAGDLNYWSWQGESEEEYLDMSNRFKMEMKKIEGKHFDIAFLPVDSRQEDRYWWGFDYFMKTTITKVAFPMHFWDDYKIISKLKELECTESYRDRIIEITSKEKSFEF